MAPSVATDGMALLRNRPQDVGVPRRMLADGEECRLRAVSGKRRDKAGGVCGHGPSSKVRTISSLRRKSWSLKCSKPNPGPPAVSMATVRITPSGFGLPGHAVCAVACDAVATMAKAIIARRMCLIRSCMFVPTRVRRNWHPMCFCAVFQLARSESSAAVVCCALLVDWLAGKCA